jgi:uncharacterized delta-60 repeat protein
MRSFGTLAALIALLWVQPTLAAPGDPDPTFGGGDGKATYAYMQQSDYVSALAQQRDGKIVAAGYTYPQGGGSSMAILRLKPDGSLDSSFGAGGKLISTEMPRAQALAVRDDGKILVIGVGVKGLKLVQLTSDGTLDQAFGVGGSVSNGFGGLAYGEDLAILPDGRILVAGDRYQSSDVLLARYLPDGKPDSTFGVGGKVIHAVAGATVRVQAITLLPNGKIAVAGFVEDDAGSESVLEVLFAADGTPDPAFGPDGTRIYPLGTGDAAAVDVLPYPPNDTVLICRAHNGGAQQHFALLRVGPTGLIEGSEITDLNVDSRAAAGAVRADGKIVVVGSVGATFGLYQYTSSLQLDPSFGNGGVAKVDFLPAAIDTPEAALIQGDGKVVLGGWAPQTAPLSAPDFAFARMQGFGAPLLADHFASGGPNWIQVTGSWTKSNGYLSTSTPGTARANAPATWSPSGASSCSHCTILTSLGFLAGGTTSKITLFAWNQSATNRVLLVYAQRTGKWMLKQQANGSSIRRRVKWRISQLYRHDIGLSFTGADLLFSLDGKPLIRIPAIASPSGNVGVQIKNGSIAVDDVLIY